MPFSRGSSRPRDRTHISCITGGFFTPEPPGKPPLHVEGPLYPRTLPWAPVSPGLVSTVALPPVALPHALANHGLPLCVLPRPLRASCLCRFAVSPPLLRLFLLTSLKALHGPRLWGQSAATPPRLLLRLLHIPVPGSSLSLFLSFLVPSQHPRLLKVPWHVGSTQ